MNIRDYRRCCGAKIITNLALKDFEGPYLCNYSDTKYASIFDYHIKMHTAYAYLFVPLSAVEYARFKKQLKERGFEFLGRTGEAYMMVGRKGERHVL